ncbi:hypothetical protein SLEP1_g37849 [Rubroshorea leprosula]|uniref:Uncharacterized protein n=1 Tax=Rubroshorea leprosula TaxID=152421 RepID=A0AAV5KWD0_9ROSI|nr:hypothetical protein SLEP1_g37849 [Rubroshorea leprosula]
MDINRDIIGEANHLSGHSFSAHDNIIHPLAELGSKTTEEKLYARWPFAVGPRVCLLLTAAVSRMGKKDFAMSDECAT